MSVNLKCPICNNMDIGEDKTLFSKIYSKSFYMSIDYKEKYLKYKKKYLSMKNKIEQHGSGSVVFNNITLKKAVYG